MRRSRDGWVAVLLTAACMICGCQRKAPAPTIPLYPVKGKVLCDGAPAFGASIKLLPVTDQAKPQAMQRTPGAIVGPEGDFEVSYFDANDGAPAGKYQVLVFWLEVPEGGGLPMDRFRGKYCNPDKPVMEIDVLEAPNLLPPIQLTR